VNAAQPDYVAGNHTSQAYATGSILAGNTRRIVNKLVKLKLMEDLGTWDVRRALRTNKLAGFDSDDVDSMRLFGVAPFSVAPLKPAAPGAHYDTLLVYFPDTDRFLSPSLYLRLSTRCC
jgi:hypothetical protein